MSADPTDLERLERQVADVAADLSRVAAVVPVSVDEFGMALAAMADEIGVTVFAVEHECRTAPS